MVWSLMIYASGEGSLCNRELQSIALDLCRFSLFSSCKHLVVIDSPPHPECLIISVFPYRYCLLLALLASWAGLAYVSIVKPMMSEPASKDVPKNPPSLKEVGLECPTIMFMQLCQVQVIMLAPV